MNDILEISSIGGYLKISQDKSGYLKISFWGELPDVALFLKSPQVELSCLIGTRCPVTGCLTPAQTLHVRPANYRRPCCCALALHALDAHGGHAVTTFETAAYQLRKRTRRRSIRLNELECHGGAVIRDKVAVAASGCTEGDNVR